MSEYAEASNATFQLIRVACGDSWDVLSVSVESESAAVLSRRFTTLHGNGAAAEEWRSVCTRYAVEGRGGWNALCGRGEHDSAKERTTVHPRQLSKELREGQSADLTRRRWVLGLSLVGTAMGAIVSLYQTGIIRTLPDPPGSIFDSARVDASDYGYRRLQTPDALMMVVSYGVTAWLAGAGGKDRAGALPWVPVAMGLKIVADVLTALELGREEWQENKALCAYCQVATICSLASAALAFPEVKRGLRTLVA